MGSDVQLGILLSSTFSLQIAIKREPTSGLEPLTCSSYEFACARSSPSYCVRELHLFRGFWVVRRCRFVHCVPARTSPVAVRVAVHTWSAIRARDNRFAAAVRG